MNNHEKYCLTKEQKFKKKQMLVQMKNDIETMEMQIKNPKIYNFKRCAIKNLKISLKFSKFLAPFFLTPAITIGAFKVIGLGTPFYGEDLLKKNLNIKKTFDSLGNVKYEKQYDDYENTDELIYYYSSWQKTNNEYYERNVEIYNLGKLEEKSILKLFENKNLNLSDIFGEPVLKKVEKKNNLTKEELEQKNYLQAVIYDKDKNNFTMVKETLKENVSYSLLWLLFTVIAEGITIGIKLSSYPKFKKYLEEIKEDYSKESIEGLKKKLEIKRNNYNMLMR